jgi:bifunctional UDP-N-acetylglucosamine pyrophosphorylase/glucosamine-1-phosphate N-acetyltransferase
MNVVILAAGMGKRMQSALPKVLHPVAGKALLSHVIDTARSLSPAKLCVIYGHGGAAVLASLDKHKAVPGTEISAALQEPQLGTGHAVQQALPHLDEDQPTLVLYGDVPLTSAASLKRLAEAAGQDKLAILTVVQDNPFGLGRIVRVGGAIQRIVEEKDATEAERLIKEINSGIMVIPTLKLKQWLGKLKNENAQGEYYLTDIVAMAGRRRASRVGPPGSAMGSTGREQQGATGRTGTHLPAQCRQLPAGQRRDPGRPGAHRRARRTILRP